MSNLVENEQIRIQHKKLEELLLNEEVKGETRANRITLIIGAVSIFILTIVSIWSRHRVTRIWDIIQMTVFFIYHITLFILLKKGKYKPFMKYITVSFNLLFVTAVCLNYGNIAGSMVHSLRTAAWHCQFLLIVLSGIYHRPAVPVYAGILAAVLYSGVFFYAVLVMKLPLTTDETFFETVLSIDAYLVMIGMYITSGGVLAYITGFLKGMLQRSLDSEAESYYLDKINKTIEETHTQKTNFFINIAHESKTPLTLIQNYLARYMANHGDERDLEIVMTNVQKLLRDMTNFMDIEKLEKGRLVYDHTRIVNFSAVLSETLPLFADLGRKKGINFESAIQDNMYIQADPAALDRIMNNLIDNALRYTDKDGKVSVSLHHMEGMALFTVHNTGSEIPEGKKENLFIPFYQLSREKRNIQGIGMGLAIVKGIVDTLEGTIEVESNAHKGTRFTIALKRCTPKEAQKVYTNIKNNTVSLISYNQDRFFVARPPRKGLPSLLVVEDNKDLLSYLVELLEHKYNVFPSIHGKNAIKQLEQIPKPDLIISDIMMDEMDGWALYRELSKHKEFRHIPFIFLTAKTAVEDEVAALSQGAIDFVHKPFNAETLEAKIESIIQNRKLRDILYEKDKFATLGMLLGGISHEIFNPLSGIIAPLENIERIMNKSDLKDNEKLQDYFDEAHLNAGRIIKLVQSLKSVYREKNIEKEEINLEEAATTVSNLFQPQVKYSINISYSGNDNPVVHGDRQALIQIVSNLISNAIDAIDGKGEITLVAEKVNGTQLLRVKDTGRGMTQEECGKIFNAFYSGKEVGKGTGMGLFIVKDLVMKLDWSIQVNSWVGVGTEFTLFF